MGISLSVRTLIWWGGGGSTFTRQYALHGAEVMLSEVIFRRLIGLGVIVRRSGSDGCSI